MKKKKIEYYLIGLLVSAILPILFFIMILFIFLGSPTVTEPIQPPTTIEKAEEYAYVTSELGVDFTLVLISDYMYALQNGESDLENNNPLVSSIEFMQIHEFVEEYRHIRTDTWEETYVDENGEEQTRTKSKKIYKWVTIGDEYIKGKDDILSYLGLDEKGINDLTVYKLQNSVYEKEQEVKSEYELKSQYDIKVKLKLSVNENYKECLLEIGLDEENANRSIELASSKYLEYLYFGNALSVRIEDYELPNITVGDVTREELLQIAGSIINLPYLWGGKYPQQGIPTHGLDCSGYVDWVYYQAFGKTIYNNLPSGVAISGTAHQFYACEPISKNELKIGDLGFYYDPSTMSYGQINHVGIYIGNGQFIHCGGASFGTSVLTTGRVGISNNFNLGRDGFNADNIINDIEFEPMKPSNFKYYGRPQFEFKGDVEEIEHIN